MNKYIKISFFVSVLFLMMACNNKNSLAGFPDGTINNYEVTLPDSCFDIAYTWGDSIKPFTENTKLVLGSSDNIQARSLIRFLTLPSSVETVSNVSLRLRIFKNMLNSTTQFTIHRVSKSWLESQATWENNKTDYNWTQSGGDFESTPLATFSVSSTRNDSVYVNLPASLIQSWIEEDSLNYGIIIKQSSKSRNNRFIEFYSSESYDDDLAPVLTFTYTDSDGDTLTYSKMAYSDTFIHDAQMSAVNDSNILSLWNITPKALALKVRLPYQIFSQADSSITSEDDLRFITINRADLILTKSDDELPYTNIKNNVSAYLLNIPMNNQTYFGSDDYTFYHSTQDTLFSNTLKVNVTGLIQAYTSKIKTNNGFLIKSNYQGMDFSKRNFFSVNCPNVSKRPKISIKFSSLRKE